jgi:hypothetical protein
MVMTVQMNDFTSVIEIQIIDDMIVEKVSCFDIALLSGVHRQYVQPQPVWNRRVCEFCCIHHRIHNISSSTHSCCHYFFVQPVVSSRRQILCCAV